MTVSFEYKRQALKFLKKYDTYIVNRLMNKIENTLSKNFVPHDAKTITNKHGVFRIRIGMFRVLYWIDYDRNEIIITKIDKRSRIY